MTKSKGEKKKHRQRELLAVRFLNSLPYANSVKDYYKRIKESNELLRSGFNRMESCASTISAPIVSRYIPLEKYAFSHLEKDKVTLKSATEAVVYSFAYIFGMAKYTQDTMRSEVVDKTYEVANKLVDNLMPPEPKEKERDQKKATNSQRRSPIGTLKKRANFHNLVNLPKNILVLWKDCQITAAFITLGLSTFMLRTIFEYAHALTPRIDIGKYVPYLRTEVFRLYKVTCSHGAMLIITILDGSIQSAISLTEYLERQNLSQASLSAFFAQELKHVRQWLVGNLEIAQVKIPSKPQGAHHAGKKRDKLPQRGTSDRIPSIIHVENQADQRKVELEAKRMPTIIYGDIREGKQEWKEEEPKEIPLRAREKATRKEHPKKMPKEWHGIDQKDRSDLQVVKEWPVYHEPFKPIKRSPEINKQDFLSVKPKYLKQLADESTPPTPMNSPSTLPISLSASQDMNRDNGEKMNQRMVSGRMVSERLQEEKKREERMKEEASEKEIAEEKREQEEGWEKPKHPIHIVVEPPPASPSPNELPAPENNPYAKLIEVKQESKYDTSQLGMPSM